MSRRASFAVLGALGLAALDLAACSAPTTELPRVRGWTGPVSKGSILEALGASEEGLGPDARALDR